MHVCKTRLSAERVAACAKLAEPCLLVGETGTGKTSSVQHIAHAVGQRLTVINLNQQTDAADLLGGFKPVEFSHLARPVLTKFEKAFCKTFSRKQNAKFLKELWAALRSKDWARLLKQMQSTLSRVFGPGGAGHRGSPAKSPKQQYGSHGGGSAMWAAVRRQVGILEAQCAKHSSSSFAFAFVEGALVHAIRSGYLAPANRTCLGREV